jgi:hypothetical protein
MKIKAFKVWLILAFVVTGSVSVFSYITPEEFDAVTPMEQGATDKTVENFVAKYPDKQYLVFTENALSPVRYDDLIPQKWIDDPKLNEFSVRARPNEFLSFQIAVFAARCELEDVKVTFSDLAESNGHEISASSLRCFNAGGVDWLGRDFVKEISVEKGKLQALWIGVDFPEDARGFYNGTVTITPKNAEPQEVALTLIVGGPVALDRGDDNLYKHSRLRWLDSTIGLEDVLTKPYTPIELKENNVIKCLGRTVELNNQGICRSIKSMMTPDGSPAEILAGPIRLEVKTADGWSQWKGGKVEFLLESPTRVEWQSSSYSGTTVLDTHAYMEYDGHITYQLTFRTHRDADIEDIRIVVPFTQKASRYFMGLDKAGGLFPAEGVDWKWNKGKSQDSCWIGGVYAGMQTKFKGPNYVRPIVNVYKLGKLNMPKAWYNDGKGGITAKSGDDKTIILTAYSGPRSMKKGENLRFDFDMLITPVKPVDLKTHWATRYYHSTDIEGAKKDGANTINIHHAQDINKFINYPFHKEVLSDLTDFIKSAHAENLKVKLYYTIRELTIHAAEFWALRTFDHEFFPTTEGVEGNIPKGKPWLQKHVRKDYYPKWSTIFKSGKYKGHTDATIMTTSLSRWSNYYCQGLDFLASQAQIDGLYLDDVAYDRTVMRRVRRILERNRPVALIDLHSSNHFNAYQGFVNPSLLYMEYFPFIDSLWFGEWFAYDKGPDYWLVEVSGLPFGMTGELLALDTELNPWRGFLYGMTGRMPYGKQNAKNTQMWQLWDSFGIQDAEMIGYWRDDCPASTGNDDIKATVYLKKGTALVSIASWAEKEADIQLNIDWDRIGIKKENAVLVQPELKGFQPAATYKPDDNIKIAPARGFVIQIKPIN